MIELGKSWAVEIVALVFGFISATATLTYNEISSCESPTSFAVKVQNHYGTVNPPSPSIKSEADSGIKR